MVDDEPPIVDSLQKIFERESLRVLTAGSGGEALEILRREPVSVLLTDLMMPGMSGIDLLRASKSVAPETETVLMTAYGTVENAVEAMKQGAYDFVTKPIKRAHLVRVVGKALEKRSLVQENRSLRAQLARREAPRADRPVAALAADDGDRHAGGAVAGDGAAARRVGDRQGAAGARDPRQLAARAAARSCRSTARRCPRRSSRRSCSATRRGPSPARPSATTGASCRPTAARCSSTRSARSRRTSRSSCCACCRRARSSGWAGGRSKVDLRLVAATNQDLRAAVREGRFREDLYYRLNVIAVPIPPLRDRRDDIPLLAEHFLQRYAARNGRHLAGFSRAAAEALARYDWPGNVRELENTVERAVVLSRGSAIEIDDLPPEVRSGGGAAGDGRTLSFAVGTPLEEIERRVIHATLAHVGGDKRLCAQLLGIATRTIYRRLEEERGDAEPAPTPARRPAPAGRRRPVETCQIGRAPRPAARAKSLIR